MNISEPSGDEPREAERQIDQGPDASGHKRVARTALRTAYDRNPYTLLHYPAILRKIPNC
jgi:hypothetical protein